MIWAHTFEGFNPWLAGSVAFRSVTEYHGESAEESGLLPSSKERTDLGAIYVC